MSHSRSSIHTFASLAFGLALFVAVPGNAQTSCLKYPSGSTAPSGYGASWDVFDSAKRLLVNADCTLDSEGRLKVSIGSGDSTQLVYKYMHSYKSKAEGWKQHELQSSGGTGNWLTGVATLVGARDTLDIPDAITPTSPYFFVGYVCTKVSGAWKCGCKNSSCATSHWQLQAYVPPGGGSGDDGDTNEPGTLPTEPAYDGTTYYVSPSGSGISTNQSSPGSPVATVEGVDDGSVVKFLPGNYSGLTFDNPKGTGRIKMISTALAVGSIDTTKRTSAPYAAIADQIVKNPRTDGARVGGKIEVLNFSAPWVEGFYFPEGSKGGVWIEGASAAWAVRNRVYNTGGPPGLFVGAIKGSGYFVALENWVWNTKRDPVNDDWGMDYAARLYGSKTSSVYFTKNLILGGFNQPVSTKENFLNTFIESNYFIAGNSKSESDPGGIKNLMIGQEPDRGSDDRTSENVYIRGNTFRYKSQAMIIANAQNVVIEGNNMLDGINALSQFYSAGPTTSTAPRVQIGIHAKSTTFRNNWISGTGNIEIWPRGDQPETLTVENNTTADGGKNSIILHRGIGNTDADRPPTSTLTIPTVNRVGGDASGFSAPQTVD